ncbi:hypothetical protein K491DRAFT_17726 [Lophiostoma macrostomum CBS 122681]|uniref:Uncharacterized protein n=1 Tax=Lophiostoma macrostomum CBS 122681 TaxID=1314788 RepID=A0A6A6TM54_9PLEO|nr:hypothetical protein K491DRAFT_17726 [Lophiostoma macrostomum CBS 122681]
MVVDVQQGSGGGPHIRPRATTPSCTASLKVGQHLHRFVIVLGLVVVPEMLVLRMRVNCFCRAESISQTMTPKACVLGNADATKDRAMTVPKPSGLRRPGTDDDHVDVRI